jgi:pimeloyl-ACP methyl ester carboxylesterase
MKPTAERPFIHQRKDGHALRGRYLPGGGDLLVFLSGFRSVHTGLKAEAFSALARRHGYSCLRFDYLGHGSSDGPFEAFRLSEAVTDAGDCIRQVLRPGQRLHLVGSSMGGWIALELARRGTTPPETMMLIAPAVDFVSRRLALMTQASRDALARDGFVTMVDEYVPGTDYRILQDFLDDALALEPGDSPLTVPCPVRIIHGDADDNVPITTSERLLRQLPSATLLPIAGGDHRLSEHLDLLVSECTTLLGLKP